jgi:hypothetical protein
LQIAKAKQKLFRNGGMEKEMLLNLQEHEMEATLTERQKVYLDSYRRCGTTAKTALDMGVSRDTTAKQLSHIAKQLGFSDIRDVVQQNRTKEKARSSDLINLIKSQDFKCALTGVELTPDTASLDHRLPRKHGGSDAVGNLQWILDDVNRMKGSLTQEEFIRLCGLVWNHNHIEHTPRYLNDL